MAYDRHETRDHPRDERSRWRDERSEGRDERFGGRDRGYSSTEDRGFFERAGDQIASWFGDDEGERRRRDDPRMEGRDRDRDWRREEERGRSSGRREFDEDRIPRSRERDFRSEREPGNQFFAASGFARGGFGPDDYQRERGNRSTGLDPHYESWRQRQLDELDRDYDDYRREHQSKFESDFGSWRERRMQKRGLLSQIREHMEVIGSDDQHVGTVDRVAGDRLILTKSDPESDGAHHSLSCADIGRVDGDRVVLDCSAEQAKQRWRDESRSRALFEREDQGEMGDRALNRSFEGTYR